MWDHCYSGVEHYTVAGKRRKVATKHSEGHDAAGKERSSDLTVGKLACYRGTDNRTPFATCSNERRKGQGSDAWKNHRAQSQKA